MCFQLARQFTNNNDEHGHITMYCSGPGVANSFKRYRADFIVGAILLLYHLVIREKNKMKQINEIMQIESHSVHRKFHIKHNEAIMMHHGDSIQIGVQVLSTPTIKAINFKGFTFLWWSKYEILDFFLL